jgi:hypothetical protein
MTLRAYHNQTYTQQTNKSFVLTNRNTFLQK